MYTGISAEPHDVSSIGEGAFAHDAAILFPHIHSLKKLESQICVCVLSRFSHLSLTLCDPMDCSPPDSSVHGIFQAIILERVAISSSRGFSRPRD